MSKCAKEWIAVALELAGEKEITKDVLVGVAEMIEMALFESADSQDFLALVEIEEMLNESE